MCGWEKRVYQAELFELVGLPESLLFLRVCLVGFAKKKVGLQLRQ